MSIAVGTRGSVDQRKDSTDTRVYEAGFGRVQGLRFRVQVIYIYFGIGD
jgi:hypothetical protein